MAEVTFDCEVVIHPIPKGLTAHKLNRELRATMDVQGKPYRRFADIVGVPSLNTEDGLRIAFELTHTGGPRSDIGGIGLRAISIVRQAIDSIEGQLAEQAPIEYFSVEAVPE